MFNIKVQFLILIINSLVFLGSKLYPYKGVLDTLANRAFAAGTNAWTDSKLFSLVIPLLIG